MADAARKLFLEETEAMVHSAIQNFDWGDYSLDDMEDITGEDWAVHLSAAIVSELDRRGMLKPQS